MVRISDLATLDELRQLADDARASQQARADAVAIRDAKITAAFEDGVSPTDMARAMRLDRQLVYRISKRAAQGR